MLNKHSKEGFQLLPFLRLVNYTNINFADKPKDYMSLQVCNEILFLYRKYFSFLVKQKLIYYIYFNY